MITHSILTTENVPFTYRVAGIGSRMWAWLLDQLLIAFILLPPFCFLFWMQWLAENFRTLPRGIGSQLALHLVAVSFFPILFFTFSEWFWSGQTPGKRLMGIRAISTEGTRLTFVQSMVRNALRLLDSMPWVPLVLVLGHYIIPLESLGFLGFYALGALVASLNLKSRRFGDLAAGTLVVHVDRKVAPVRFFLESNREAIPERELLWRQRLGSLNKEQKQTIMDLCVRRDQLRLKDRTRLFQAISIYLQDKLKIPQEENQSDERYVQQAATLLTKGS